MPSLPASPLATSKSQGVTRQQAAAELLRRREARRGLIKFAQYVDPLYVPDAFHIDVAAALEKVERGEILKLLIVAPPQHGKSRITSEIFPAYMLGKHSNDPGVIASYGADLAHSKSKEARQIVESAEYRALFGDLGPHSVTPEIDPIDTNDESRSIDEWHLSYPHRGKLRAVGIGGALTGFPAKWAVIDDPVKNLAEARSEVKRQEFKDWYRSVLRTRIQQGGAIVIIMTRWDADDAAGWLLREQPGEWTVLRYPALAETQEDRDINNKLLGLPEGLPDPLGREPGEPLAPHRFSREALLEIKKDAGSLIWAGLYDGMPRKAEGNMFKRHWFPIVDAAPRKGKRVRYWDKAGTEGGDGARTIGLLMLEAEDGLIYIEDVVGGWFSSLQRETTIKQTAEQDAIRYGSKSAVKIWIEQEPGSGGKESAESTIRNLKGFVIKADRPSGDKDTRLEPFAAQCEAGNVKLVRGSWNEDYIEEMIAIPNGKRRDQGDASSGAFNRLNDAKPENKAVPVTGLWTSQQRASRRNEPR